MITGHSATALFSSSPLMHFYPETEFCPDCGMILQVRKTWIKTVVTMDIGAFRAKETVLECPADSRIFHSTQLRKLVPVHCTFGFDVIVAVGMALFVDCRNNQEIIQEMASKNVFISEREISYLGRKFIIYLALAHRESQKLLRESIACRGGYILHVDGTCEGDSPHLFCGLDGISELILDSIKIPSESKEQLVPFFQRIKEQYGSPLALVHDMGKGIVSATDEVFPGLPDFICHFHFLRDIGKDTLHEDYVALQKRLRKLKTRSLLRQKAIYLGKKIRVDSQTIIEIKRSIEKGACETVSFEHIPLIAAYALIQWVFDSLCKSRGYGFPFDRMDLDFYRRLHTVRRTIGGIINSRRGKENKPLIQVYRLLNDAVKDKKLNDLASSLESKAAVFDRLRKAMRIALPDGTNGLNDDGEDVAMSTIKEKVVSFRQWLISNGARRKKYVKMVEQIDKYWERLFADPLCLMTPEGEIYIQPQRTNNILERFFRAEKRRSRKKAGILSLNKVLKVILADTPLVQNLRNQEYFEIILNGCSSLAERFSKIDADLVHKRMLEAQNNKERISPSIKKLIKHPDLPEKISTLFATVAK